MQRYIDHTLLKPEATRLQIQTLCEEAITHGFFSVCINPCYISLCAELLRQSSVKICTVIGFPLGANTTEAKVFETQDAIRKGADEIDMVVAIGKIKSGDFPYVENDIKSVVSAASGKTVKVIIETSLLSKEEIVLACQMAKSAGAHFVKTSTGFNGGGATVADIRLMRQTVGPAMGVKASGGVKDLKTAQALIEAGATRIGTSSGVKLIQGLSGSGGY